VVAARGVAGAAAKEAEKTKETKKHWNLTYDPNR
jgi:hypothetical protein